MEAFDAHAKPPENIKQVYKRYHKSRSREIQEYSDLIEFDLITNAPTTKIPLLREATRLPANLRQLFVDFMQSDRGGYSDSVPAFNFNHETLAYQVPDLPGLTIYPSLFPPAVQTSLLSKLLHRDICNLNHRNNVHLHYDVPMPPNGKSYFHPSASSLMFQPHDPSVHKTLTTSQFLNKKLRWTTLGGQYDWTNKQYPDSPPPAFPPDIKNLIDKCFPRMRAEAAICNLYSPGDTLSLHRDVSEECAAPLVSISLGCEAIFVCGLEGGENRVVAIRLRSGDAVIMSGESRHAWHGVPKVLEGTCPESLQSWPGEASLSSIHAQSENGRQRNDFGQWRGWMSGKRVNLNVRQMFA